MNISFINANASDLGFDMDEYGAVPQENTPMYIRPPQSPLSYSKNGVCRGIHFFLILL